MSKKLILFTSFVLVLVLTDVGKLAIGFGDRNNPQPGGSGTMYFDDIRLYRPAPEPEPVP